MDIKLITLTAAFAIASAMAQEGDTAQAAPEQNSAPAAEVSTSQTTAATAKAAPAPAPAAKPAPAAIQHLLFLNIQRKRYQTYFIGGKTSSPAIIIFLKERQCGSYIHDHGRRCTN